MALTSLQDYAVVLAQRNERGDPFLLVGGHAVNFWADTYRKHEPRLEAFHPFLSKDLDLLATTSEGQRIAAAIGWEFTLPSSEAVNVQGTLRHGSLLVELLTEQGRPLLPPEHGSLTQSDGGSPIPIRLISPEVLLVSKAALAVDTPQDGSVPEIEVRQDVRHVQMLALIVPHYLTDVLERFPDDRTRSSAVQPTLAILASVQRGRTGRRFEEIYPGVLRWSELLPRSVRTLPLDASHRRCLEQLDSIN